MSFSGSARISARRVVLAALFLTVIGLLFAPGSAWAGVLPSVDDPTDEPTSDGSTDPTSEPTTDPTTDPTTGATTDPTADPTTDPTADPSESLEATETELALDGSQAPVGEGATVTLLLEDPSGPVAGAEVSIDRKIDGVSTDVTTVTTDASGQATTTVTVAAEQADNTVIATFVGDEEHQSATATTTLSVTPAALPNSVAQIQIKVSNASGQRVVGSRTRDGYPLRAYFLIHDGQGNPRPGIGHFQFNTGSGWRTLAKVPIQSGGGGWVDHLPTGTTQYRVFYPITTSGGVTYNGDYSPIVTVTVGQFWSSVSLPAGAPNPTVTPPKAPRANTPESQGANARIYAISNKLWADMSGVSWRSGCPVGRANLRLVQVNYLGFDGYRYVGEVVVHQSIASKTARALAALYNARIPIRSMVRVDHFGYSSTLRGADDYRSMAADNTSAFNCRGVVGNPSVRSPHAYGRAIDINPWENPYHSKTGIVPNTWWASRSHPQVAWRSRSHQVIRILAANGFSWTYGTSDAHHFDG